MDGIDMEAIDADRKENIPMEIMDQLSMVEKYSDLSDYVENESTALPKNEPKNQIKKKKCAVSICITGLKYRIVSEIAKELQWKITGENNLWNIFWTDSIMGVNFCLTMHRFQKINHFPGMMEICRKDKLARNLNRMLKVFPNDFLFFPKTWSLPTNYADALSYGLKKKNKIFIIKPAASAQGKGIYLTQSLQHMGHMEGMICQVYVKKPLLIDGFKFDLRVYALITSLNPLRIYIHNEGLTRFATKPYKPPARDNTKNSFMHLTNYSINKSSETFSTDKDRGSKRTFSKLNGILSKGGFDVAKLWEQIDDIVIKTVISGLPTLKHNYSASFPRHDVIQACFEILGIDIIIDEDLKPWLLEVNHSPSFSTSELVDIEVKSVLIRDTFNLLGVKGTDRRNVLHEDQNRIKSRMTKGIMPQIASNSRKSSKNGEKKSDTGLKDRRDYWDKKQDAWEESHLGGFRRIMPLKGGNNLYSKFLNHLDNESVSKETISTQQKRLAAVELTRSIKKKIVIPPPPAKPKPIKKSIPKNNFQSIDAGYLPNTIADWEEKERTMMMDSRSFLVENCGIRAAFCHEFQLKQCDHGLKSNNV